MPQPPADPRDVDPTAPTNERTTGTVDDDDEMGDETEGENEAPIRETNDTTEAPEEFEEDEEDALPHPEDDDADDDLDDDADEDDEDDEELDDDA